MAVSQLLKRSDPLFAGYHSDSFQKYPSFPESMDTPNPSTTGNAHGPIPTHSRFAAASCWLSGVVPAASRFLRPSWCPTVMAVLDQGRCKHFICILICNEELISISVRIRPYPSCGDPQQSHGSEKSENIFGLAVGNLVSCINPVWNLLRLGLGSLKIPITIFLRRSAANAMPLAASSLKSTSINFNHTPTFLEFKFAN